MLTRVDRAEDSEAHQRGHHSDEIGAIGARRVVMLRRVYAYVPTTVHKRGTETVTGLHWGVTYPWEMHDG